MSRSSRMLLMFASALTFIAFFANFCVVAAPHLPGPKVMRQSQVSRPTPPPVRPEPQPGVPQGGPTSGADVSMAFTNRTGGTLVGLQPGGSRMKLEIASTPSKVGGHVPPLPTVLRPPVINPPTKWVPTPIDHEGGLATGYLFRLQ